MKRLSRLAILYAAIALLFSLPIRAAAADSPPDFTGVWVGYAAEPEFVRTGTQALTESGQALQDAYLSQYPNWVEPGAWCVPPGMPSTMTSLVAYPIEVIQKGDQLTMLAELEMQVRRVFIDGRDFPDDYPPTRMGYSIGHWEQDPDLGRQVLVIETQLLKETLDGRWPRTENMEITERVYMATREEVGKEPSGFVATIAPPINNDTLVFELTITDPALYAGPITQTVYYQRMSDDIFLEYDCAVARWQEALEEANQ